MHGNGQIEIQEHFTSPMVYLDHWALNDFSLDDNLRYRFVDLANRKGGTVRLSVFNIYELSRQSDAIQVNAILEMIDSISDCGLINVDPRAVIEKEDILLSDPSMIVEVKNPSAELEIVAAHVMAHNYPTVWHVSDIIRAVVNAPPSKALDSDNKAFVQDMSHLLDVGRRSKESLRRARTRFKRLKRNGPQQQAATRELYRMALDFVLKNSGMKMSQHSEWVDLFHVVVPVSYCDIVMIDKRWSSFVAQTGFSYPKIARVFDKKSVNQFFQAVEEWNIAVPQA